MFSPQTQKTYPQSRVPGTTAHHVKVACSNRYNFKTVRFRIWYRAMALLLILGILGGNALIAQPRYVPQNGVHPGPIPMTSGLGSMVWDLTGHIDSCADQTGAIWCSQTVNFGAAFEINFYASFSNGVGMGGLPGGGADGICVVFGPNFDTTTTPGGGSGGDLGYYLLPGATTHPYNYLNSFAVEYDIFYNVGVGYGDNSTGGTLVTGGNSDHTAIALNQIFDNFAPGGHPLALNDPTGIRDSVARKCSIKWDPSTDTLKVYYDCILRLASYYDYAGYFRSGGYDSTQIHWGITASTGGQCSHQNVSFINFITTHTLCLGGGETLYDAIPGGTWSSLDTTKVIAGSTTGHITGVSAGTAQVIYIPSGGACIDTFNINILSIMLPAIGGDTPICAGSTISLTDTATGGVWSSNDSYVATVDSSTGIVTGVSIGYTTISYTNSEGCYVDTIVTVNLPPDVDSITGSLHVCLGSYTTLSDSIPGGAWSSGATGIATVGSTTGIVHGVAIGVAPISYSVTNGCGTVVAVVNVTVNTVLSPGIITGLSSVCSGHTTTLSDTVAGGVWSSGATAIATVGSTTGIVTGVSGGVVLISYSVTNGCGTTVATRPVTVFASPPILGRLNICIGYTDTLTDSIPGGRWSSSNPAIASIDSVTGIITTHATSSVTITYTMPGTGCYVTAIVSINQNPFPISCTTTSLCVGYTTTMTDVLGGGHWSSSNIAVATADSIGITSGIVTATGTGTATITYTITSTGCFIDTTVTVYLPTLSGGTIVCSGATTTLTFSPAGGSWTSVSTTVATVAGGIVTGVSTGTSLISYSFGGSCFATTTVTVLPAPSISVNPTPPYYCSGGSSVLTASGTSTSYTWSPGATLTATSGPSVTANPTVTTTYTVTGTNSLGCTNTATVTITVNPLPVISVSGHDCTNDTMIVSTGVAGYWITGGTASISAYPAGVGSIEVIGHTAGTVTITFTDSATGCRKDTSFIMLVSPPPITGTNYVCVGSTITLHDADSSSGRWNSSLIYAGIGTHTGIVTGTSGPGVQPIIFVDTVTLCAVLYLVTVNPLPAPITGATAICTSTADTLRDTTIGGIWSISPVIPFTTIAGGIVITSSSAGTEVVDYTLPATGCHILDTIHINPDAGAIAPRAVCLHSTVTLTSTDTGGHWTTDTLHGTIGYSSGIFTGTSPGLDTVTYTVGGCSTTTVVTVNALPSVTVNPTVQIYCSSAAITAGGLGGTPGYTYSWLPATGLSSTGGAAVSISGLTADIIYTVTCMDANGCKATDTSKVVVPCGSACNSCGTPTLLGATGTITGGPYTGMYYIDNNVTITGTATFSGAIVAIKPGVTISVNPTATVSIDQSHFYCCSETGMWQGFLMQSAGVNTAIMNIGRSLIEDANTAIRFSSPAVTTGVLLNCNNVVFNRNLYGIQISGYATTSTYYPFSIGQCVFTSRNFELYNSGGNYPCHWPLFPDLTGGGYMPTSQVYLPMQIDNPLGMPVAGGSGHAPYDTIGCKTGGRCWMGIFLNSVGPTTCTPSYPGFVINGPMLFDNLSEGIEAQNSSLTVSGCHFAHIKKHIPYNGDGVYATKSFSGKMNLTVGSSVATTNYFYSCTNAVLALNYTRVTCNFDSIYSDHTTAAMAALDGNYGFKIGTTPFATDSAVVTMHNNYIVNIYNAISYSCYNEGHGGNINIYNNKIIAAPADFPNGLTNMGIYAANGSPATGINTGQLQILGNEIYLAYNGVSLNGFKRKIPWSWGNEINLLPNPASTLPEYGVYYVNNTGAKIGHNFVTGHAPTDANITSITGIYGENNAAVDNSCNNSQNVYKGFSFKGTTNLHCWKDNYMINDHVGYYLNGIIGPQPNLLGTYPCNNYWDSTWAGGASGVFQTYTYYSSPNSSKLWVQDTLHYNPTVDSAILPIQTYTHLSSGGLGWGTGIGDHPSCYTPVNLITWRTTSDSMGDSANITGAVYVYELAARDSIIDTGLAMFAERNWIAQMATFQAIQADTTLLDSSAILVKFDTLAQASRYNWLTQIANAIDTGNYTLAQNLLLQNIDTYIDTARDSATGVVIIDSAGADYVVQNYLAYFHLYLKYINSTLNVGDSANLGGLASQCPETAGNIIFNARALYNMVFDTIANFGDACSDDTLARFGNPFGKSTQNGSDIGQQYNLYPNPNDGKITLMQSVLDMKPLKIELINAYGQKQEEFTAQFLNFVMQLNLGKLNPGLYLLHLTNSYGNTFNLKFVAK